MPSRHAGLRSLLPIYVLASTLFLNVLTPAMANPGDVNSINDGQNVAGGTFYNTPGDKTTFINSAGTGLFISTGTTVIGREVSNAANPAGSLTGNGGWLHFNAPGQVVRVDGNINVNALMNGGAYIGNGGRVTVDSSYLYQNGQITANGINGGHVQFNVGHLTLGPNAAIYAQGVGGQGGSVIAGNGNGVVDIQQGAIVDVSGKVIGQFDTNLIAIQGGLINMEGILIANGVQTPTRGGETPTVANYSEGENSASGSGGAVVLVATGNTATNTQDILNTSPLLAGPLQANLVARNNSLIQGYDGWIRVGSSGKIMTNGGVADTLWQDGGNGGLIALLAKCGIENNGLLQSNGGNGGDGFAFITPIYQHSGESIYNPQPFSEGTYTTQTTTGAPGGNGGQGGLIALSYGKKLINNGTISVLGGNAGDGGNANSNPEVDYTYAQGGYGGVGGDGGDIIMAGPHQPNLNNGLFLVNEGKGGQGGLATANTFAENGPNGEDGVSGEISFEQSDLCDGSCTANGGPIVPAFNPNPGNDVNPDLHGLFQTNRPVFNERLNQPQQTPLTIALGQSNMFLAKTYRSVTQDILNRALNEYTRLLQEGQPAGTAQENARTVLIRSGIDGQVALILLERIKAGDFTASDVLVQMLKDIADSSKTSALPLR